MERLALLTRQHSRILHLICDGQRNKQTHDLSIAETNGSAQVTTIMRKRGVHSRTQALLTVKAASFAALLPKSG